MSETNEVQLDKVFPEIHNPGQISNADYDKGDWEYVLNEFYNTGKCPKDKFFTSKIGVYSSPDIATLSKEIGELSASSAYICSGRGGEIALMVVLNTPNGCILIKRSMRNPHQNTVVIVKKGEANLDQELENYREPMRIISEEPESEDLFTEFVINIQGVGRIKMKDLESKVEGFINSHCPSNSQKLVPRDKNALSELQQFEDISWLQK